MDQNISVDDTDRKEEMMAEENKKTIAEQAKDEMKEELLADGKNRLKAKMCSLYNAKQVVSNLERELADLELEISDKINAL